MVEFRWWVLGCLLKSFFNCVVCLNFCILKYWKEKNVLLRVCIIYVLFSIFDVNKIIRD